MNATRRYPVDRLKQYESEIRAIVALARSSGLADDDVAVFVLADDERAPVLTWLRRDGDPAKYVIARTAPDLADDYDKRKPGHVTVVVVAPEGKGVFGVRIAR